MWPVEWLHERGVVRRGKAGVIDWAMLTAVCVIGPIMVVIAWPDIVAWWTGDPVVPW